MTSSLNHSFKISTADNSLTSTLKCTIKSQKFLLKKCYYWYTFILLYGFMSLEVKKIINKIKKLSILSLDFVESLKKFKIVYLNIDEPSDVHHRDHDLHQVRHRVRARHLVRVVRGNNHLFRIHNLQAKESVVE